MRLLKKIRDVLVRNLFPIVYKRYHELRYWKKQYYQEKCLYNEHYKKYYTKYINMEESAYKNKNILDVGCGPRGSLEWATMCNKRIGIDPLAEKYLELGANKHSMEYVSCNAEAMPFTNDYFDYIFSYNSLDHVENVEKVLDQIKRVLKSKGHFFLW